MANEAVKLICSIGETLAGKLMTVNALNNMVLVFKIAQGKQAEIVKAETTVSTSKEIDKTTLDQWLSESPDEIYLIDVREDYEHEEFNIGGVNISLYELTSSLKSIPKNKKVVCYCQTGQRSKMALQLLEGIYEGEVYSLTGKLL